MKTRKIFAAAMAGLCAVSTMGVSAFAADEKVETAGTKSYKVNAAFQAPTIDVTVPEEIAAVINPYMIAVKIDNVTYEAEGIASPRYTITNNSAEVGINIKATHSADGLDGIVDEADKATDTTKNTEKKKLAYVTLNSTTTIDDDAETTLVMDTEEKTELLLTLEEKATGKANAGQIWIGGATIEDPAEKWSASDKLSINVVLDINPYNPAGGGAGGTSFTDPADLTGAITAGTGASKVVRTGDAAYTAELSLASVGSATPVTTAFSIPLASGKQILSVSTSDASVVAASSTNVMVKANSGTATLTIKTSSDGMTDDGQTITIVVTAVA